MRTQRLKRDSKLEPGTYHVMSRSVARERLFGQVEKEVMFSLLTRTVEFCGARLLTYALMEDHFHFLVTIPKEEPVSDDEVIRRYKVLYPKPSGRRPARVDVMAKLLKENAPEGIEWRDRQLRQMGDLSILLKLFKQRFSVWYNAQHDRIGTLWAERFKSVLVDPSERYLGSMGGYIDLNPVRAGIVADPKDYRHCGYAEAVAGSERARKGIMEMLGIHNWEEAQAAYRLALFGTGAGEKEGKASIPLEDFEKVLKEKGKLPLPTLLRCRIRHFTEGAALGSEIFVQGILAEYRMKNGLRLKYGPHKLTMFENMPDLALLRGQRRQAIIPCRQV